MGSDSGGTTTTKPPQWWTDAAKYAVGQGKKTAEIGYVPYEGPDVAAFRPQQIAGMQDAANWSAAFNTPGQAPMDVASTIMPATDFGGGLQGYSSYGGYQDALANLAQNYPGLYSYINSFFPHTGLPGATTPPTTPDTNTGGGGGSNVPPPVTAPRPPPKNSTGKWVKGSAGQWVWVNNYYKSGASSSGPYSTTSAGSGGSYNLGLGGGMGSGGLAARGGMTRGPTNINPGGGWFGGSSAGGGFNHGFAS